MDKSRKKVAILFSGGLDSTYLMWKNLKEGNEVYPIYLEIINNNNKVIVEKQQTQRLLNLFRKDYPYNLVNDMSYNFSVNVIKTQTNVSFPQPLIWAIGSQFSINEKVDELHIGYMWGDESAVSNLDKINELYKTITNFTHNKIEVKFPLIEEKIWKEDMIYMIYLINIFEK